MTVSQVKYTGDTPGADTNTYNLFDSTVAFPGARMAQMAGMKRIRISLQHSDDGDFVLSKSEDRGATWLEIDRQGVTAAADTDSFYDAVITPYDDFKVDWANTGNSAQDPWVPSIALDNEASPS